MQKTKAFLPGVYRVILRIEGLQTKEFGWMHLDDSKVGTPIFIKGVKYRIIHRNGTPARGEVTIVKCSSKVTRDL